MELIADAPVLGTAAALVAVVVLVLLALLAGTRIGARRQRSRRVEAERARLDAELSLAEQTTRLHIARELNAAAVASLTGIVREADGARYSARSDAGAAERSAERIAGSARSALATLRRVATVEHDGDAPDAPQPGLDSLEELFALMREAGLAVVPAETGERYELPAGAELAVYRILQEALANALAHGGTGTEAHVGLHWSDEGLRVVVEDDGRRAAAVRAGRDPDDPAERPDYTVEDDLHALTEAPEGPGITAMRRRAALYGGLFQAQVLPGVGFGVTAVFPSLRYHNGIHGVRLGAS
jgi:signal transduction histidine kinase